MGASLTRSRRFRVKTDGYAWLNAAAIEANPVWNWCNATSLDAADRDRGGQARFLSGFDLLLRAHRAGYDPPAQTVKSAQAVSA